MKINNIPVCSRNSEGKLIRYKEHLWNNWKLKSNSIWWIIQTRNCRRCGFTQTVKEEP